MEDLDQRLWRQARLAALERDSHRCVVADHDGSPCRGTLHVHHLLPVYDPYDVDGLATVCASHHRKWEVLARKNLELVR